ncbi:MAG: hypothetical protein AMJ75_10730 [Phycisphaerae bacterium SM1_79]|nr:MAG: hypothetical protein AMJ75_10730 [Phycisphaerae bacterium SM1_79]
MDQVHSDAPAVNIRTANTKVNIDIINVSSRDTELCLFGKNSSTEPTISGKKTGISRIVVSNL